MLAEWVFLPCWELKLTLSIKPIVFLNLLCFVLLYPLITQKLPIPHHLGFDGYCSDKSRPSLQHWVITWGLLLTKVQYLYDSDAVDIWALCLSCFPHCMYQSDRISLFCLCNLQLLVLTLTYNVWELNLNKNFSFVSHILGVWKHACF